MPTQNIPIVMVRVAVVMVVHFTASVHVALEYNSRYSLNYRLIQVNMRNCYMQINKANIIRTRLRQTLLQSGSSNNNIKKYSAVTRTFFQIHEYCLVVLDCEVVL